LVLTIFNEGAYLTFMSIFHKALNLFQFDCEITLHASLREEIYASQVLQNIKKQNNEDSLV